ncbi:MAG TPA: DUF1616 domain-containing protein [Actinocrinis sp.]
MSRAITSLRSVVAAQRAGGGVPAAVAGALSLANLPVPGVWKAVLGLPLAFWAPGYCVAILIFGHASWAARFDGLVRRAAECVLSMAAWPLLVLLAYAIEPRVTASSVERCFLVLVIATLIRVQLTTRSAGSDEAAAPRYQPQPQPRARFSERVPRALIAAVAVIVLGGGLTAVLAYSLPPQQSSTASAAALAGTAATADTPLARETAQGGEVSVTIFNSAPVAHDYRITATVTGAGTWTATVTTVAADSQTTAKLRGALPSTACLSRVSIVVSDGSQRLQPLVAYFRGNESGSCDQ